MILSELLSLDVILYSILDENESEAYGDDKQDDMNDGDEMVYDDRMQLLLIILLLTLLVFS